MLFALVMLSILLMNTTAEKKDSEKKKNLPRQLYEEFFFLVKDGLVWNNTMAHEADKELKKKGSVRKGYLEVLLKRNIDYPMFSTGVDVLLTLERIWVELKKLDKVKELCEGTHYGCNYDYKWNKQLGPLVRVLCFFVEEDQ